MKLKNLVIIIAIFFVSNACAQVSVEAQENEFLYGFLKGPYQVIGRFPDSSKTYTGTVVFKNEYDHFEIIRIIEGNMIKGTGKIETATAEKTKVLRVHFVERNKHYEITYIIHSDLDNYGRLTGYLYLKKGQTKIPGLEALFTDYQAIENDLAPNKANAADR